MRLRTSVLIIVLGLIAVAIASVLSMYPSLSDARDAAERAWSQAQPPLDARYDRAAALSRAVRAQRADLDLLDQLDDALGDWQQRAGERPTPDPGEEPGEANVVEGHVARLARLITTTPSLRENPDIVAALREFLDQDVAAVVLTYNEAVESFDAARNRFPGRFFATLIGFEGLRTVEISGALDDLEVPEPPPPTTTTSAPGEPEAAESPDPEDPPGN